MAKVNARPNSRIGEWLLLAVRRDHLAAIPVAALHRDLVSISGGRSFAAGLREQASNRLRRDKEYQNARQSAGADHSRRTKLTRPHQARPSAKGLGHRHAQMTAWLDENCGSDGWAMALSRMEAC
jgi:hypothetical protein